MFGRHGARRREVRPHGNERRCQQERQNENKDDARGTEEGGKPQPGTPRGLHPLRRGGGKTEEDPANRNVEIVSSNERC